MRLTDGHDHTDARRAGADEPHHDANPATRVYQMRLRGAIRVFVLEGDAVESSPGVERGVAQKLGVLTRQGEAQVVAYRMSAQQREALARVVPSERIAFADGETPADIDQTVRLVGVSPAECLAILSSPATNVPDGCHYFYVGHGTPPAHAIATRDQGVRAANRVLGLYGTALMQERAGAAFRASSVGGAIPDSAELSAAIWEGVRRSVERTNEGRPVAPSALPDKVRLRDVARQAYQRLRANLLPSGAVVASPAHGTHPGEPNYRFFWQRDGAATFARLIAQRNSTVLGIQSGDLAEPIARYLEFLAVIQGTGPLGTSRYLVTGEPVLGYGNPQLDGPALTVLALKGLNDPTRTWPLVRPFLDFLRSPEGIGRTMDPWEFVYGRTFNATLLRRKALLAGARLAEALHQADAADRCRESARVALAELDAFEDRATGRLIFSRDTLDPWFEVTSGLDMATIFALLAGVPDPIASTPGELERPGATLDRLAHPAVLATMAALEDEFASLYRVNRGWRAGGNAGWGMGRFPEDANDGLGSSGGNPWPLVTLWAAQFYYLLMRELIPAALGTSHGMIFHDPRQVTFINRATGTDVVEVDRPVAPDVWRKQISIALWERGDSFLNFVVHHLADDGGVTEQIDCETGRPRGAPDLSWALAELIYAIALRSSP